MQEVLARVKARIAAEAPPPGTGVIVDVTPASKTGYDLADL